MKSGLEDRNTEGVTRDCFREYVVSMKSGLEDRNNFQQAMMGFDASQLSQ